MDIQIDLSGLKIKDLALFENAKEGGMSQKSMVEILDRVVVGGAAELPLTVLPEVMAALTAAMAELSNPKDGQGKA